MGRIIIKGNRRGTLYTFKDSPKANYSIRFHTVNRQVWHHRLGHCQLEATVNALHSRGVIKLTCPNNFSVCESCQIGKQHKLPFVKRMDSPYAIMDQVHCDLWEHDISSTS